MLLPPDQGMLNRIPTSGLPWISEAQPKQDEPASLTIRMTALKGNMFMKVCSSFGHFRKSQGAHLEGITSKMRIPIASVMFEGFL